MTIFIDFFPALSELSHSFSFSFPFGMTVGPRGWYDSPQSALRPAYEAQPNAVYA